MKFNHLNVPTHWQNYWTRYPEGHTILEALIQWVSQVDSMVDNQNKLNTNVEQFRNEIDDFVAKFDERLQDEVSHTLQDWQTSGFLDVVISDALQWELDDYKTTNEQDKLSINQQLAHLAKPSIKVDVLNPPNNLLPVNSTDPVVNTTRLQEIVNYIVANEIYYQATAGGQYTGANYELYFPTSIYTFATGVTLKGKFISVTGNRSTIRVLDNGYLFTTSGNQGWKVKIDGFTFDSCNALKQENDNLEAGRTEILNCWFYHSTKALHINKLSSQFFIEKCHFYLCTLVGEFIGDTTYIKDCYINSSERTLANPEDIINRSAMHMSDSFLIPTRDQTNSLVETAWVANHAYVSVDNCRISAESGARPTVNNYATARGQSGYFPNGVEVRNCNSLAASRGRMFIRLFAFPNILKVNNNKINTFEAVPIGFSTTFDTATIPPSPLSLYAVSVEGNVGQSSYAWQLPSELLKFQRVADMGLTDEGGILSSKNGTISNTARSFTIETDFTKGNPKSLARKVYLLKLSGQPSGAASAPYISTFVGLLHFRISNSPNTYTLECDIKEIISYSGGSASNNDLTKPIVVTAVFGDTETNTTTVGSGSEKINIIVTWASGLVDGRYSVKEIMDAR